MLRIGVLDYYLNNWHANHYPGFLREVIARDHYHAAVTTAFALLPEPPGGGVSSEDWCRERGMRLAGNLAGFLDSIDAILVIVADDARFHDLVCPLVLECQKPLFIDKTFAKAILDFFETKKSPVSPEETLEVLQIIDIAREARKKPDLWFDVG